MSRKPPVLPSFEPGVPAAEGFIPLSIPKLAGNEWRYVRECLDTNWVSSVGAFVERFEREVAARVGARFGVATASGTAALHISLLLSGVGPGDEVILPTLTFIAPANAIRYVGAIPLLLDVDPATWQLDPRKTLDFLEKGCIWEEGRLVNRATGRRVRAIMPVHILGHPVDLDPILETARKFGLAVIEDATESLGARYKDRHVGNLGDIGCFSFNGNKIITSGGGGMIVTNDEAAARRARYLTTQAKDDPIEYVHGELGYNYRLTNLQAALGVAQLEQLTDFIADKRRIAQRYREMLSSLPGISMPEEAPWATSTWWLSTISIDAGMFGSDSRTLLRRLLDRKIQCRPL
ncbi:MAG: LegC family aminotransferase, partial [Deltaproteobacteria bacterium]